MADFLMVPSIDGTEGGGAYLFAPYLSPYLQGVAAYQRARFAQRLGVLRAEIASILLCSSASRYTFA